MSVVCIELLDSVVGLLALGQQKPHRAAFAVANGVQFAVQPTFSAPDKAGNNPPFSRLHAVRCAFRCVASIISRSGGPCSSTSAVNIWSNTPIFDQRDEPVIQGFMRPVDLWRIPPTQPVADHMDDATDDLAIINPWHSV